MDLLRSTGRRELHAPIILGDRTASIGTWAGLVCVLVTGITLSVFPVQVVTWLARRRTTIPHYDEEVTKKIKLLGRLLGALFLIGAVLIGWGEV